MENRNKNDNHIYSLPGDIKINYKYIMKYIRMEDAFISNLNRYIIRIHIRGVRGFFIKEFERHRVEVWNGIQYIYIPETLIRQEQEQENDLEGILRWKKVSS